ncbi:Clp protease N-terminal domain-containing protein [Streptomyces sp. CA-181903]|uniref:Clp protease N-terminal domain-containing protein n=1 Tax=Streptomyces sp. CA-181903 TaxID=3240055 RepID=UPI003D9392F7
MFDHFTDPGKQAVVTAQDQAVDLGHDFVGTEHLLLGLLGTTGGGAGAVLTGCGVDLPRARERVVRLRQADGTPATGGQEAKDALAGLGIDADEIRRRADDSFGAGAFRFPRPAYTENAKKALTAAVHEAQALRHDRIGTEHVLLGLLAVDEGTALKVLAALGVEITVIRPTVLDALDRTAS